MTKHAIEEKNHIHWNSRIYVINDLHKNYVSLPLTIKCRFSVVEIFDQLTLKFKIKYFVQN